MTSISVVGAGAWGTTIANLIAGNGHKVTLWAKEKAVVTEINSHHRNSLYLKNISLHKNIKATSDLLGAVDNKDMVVTAIPSQFLRSVMKDLSSSINNSIIVDLAKGLEYHTFKRMSQIIDEEIKGKKTIVALSGPNHAEEVSRKLPTATVVASVNKKALQQVVDVLSTDYFKVFPHTDIVGVELCGALKNVAAIATGISSGLGYGDNAVASIMTLALTEMTRVGNFFGAKRETCYGLAGVGDLIATCTSQHSRNRFVGLQVAKGMSLDHIRKEMGGSVAEGVFTCKAVNELAEKESLHLPLTSEVYQLLYENKDIKKSIADLIYYAK